jgi:hypothetical protein
MAVIKSVEQRSGATADYWRVHRFTMHGTAEDGEAAARVEVFVTLLGYLNKKARRDGKAAMDAMQLGPLPGVVALDVSDVDKSFRSVYAAVKAAPEFAGAQDDEG